jgi:hypothetical protein
MLRPSVSRTILALFSKERTKRSIAAYGKSFHTFSSMIFAPTAESILFQFKKCFITPHNVSIGLRSGEFGGHSGKMLHSSAIGKYETSDVWQGAPSWTNTQSLRPYTESTSCMNPDSRSFSWYFPASTLPSKKRSFDLYQTPMTHHAIKEILLNFSFVLNTLGVYWDRHLRTQRLSLVCRNEIHQKKQDFPLVAHH